MQFATRDPSLRCTIEEIARLAPTSAPLVIEGETGTGKSLLARRIHAASRPGRPLIVVDLAAVPAGLVPAELFGHRAGAFTDATRAREGQLARARDGTLVLDRLESIPSEGQVALLRVIEEQRFTPVGAGTSRPLHARLIALADAGLGERIARGVVRRDLFHRLAAYHAVLPPLRDRRDDIVPIATRTLRRVARRLGRRLELDAEARIVLEAYLWPGNVREVEATMERAALTSSGSSVGVVHLGLPPSAWEGVAALAVRRRTPLAELTRLYALWVLAEEKGNASSAARALGISRRTLVRWRVR